MLAGLRTLLPAQSSSLDAAPHAGLAPRLFKASWSLAPLPLGATTPTKSAADAIASTDLKDFSEPSLDIFSPASGQATGSVYMSCTTGGATYVSAKCTPDTAPSVNGGRQVATHSAFDAN